MDKNTKLDSNYLSYEYIVNQFQTIGEKSLVIKTVLVGPIEEIDIEKQSRENYPILYIEPTGITVNNFIQTFSYNVALLDTFDQNESYNNRNLDNLEGDVNVSQLHADFSDMRNKILSDSYYSMQMVISSFVQNIKLASWVNSEVDLQMPINLTPIATQYDNMLYGWTGDFTITANNKNNLCITPIVQQT
tara:strand:+ start:2612 stop:3181 length:570 start_codon:yes stop_codon:yes gene_type:complete